MYVLVARDEAGELFFDGGHVLTSSHLLDCCGSDGAQP
jgi:hypothetical protein